MLICTLLTAVILSQTTVTAYDWGTWEPAGGQDKECEQSTSTDASLTQWLDWIHGVSPGGRPGGQDECGVKQTERITLPSKCQNLPADIHFLIDTSASVMLRGFKECKDFVSKFVNSFTIGVNDVQVGLTTYSHVVNHKFFMNKYDNKADLLTAIYNVQYEEGATRTGDGLEFVRKNAFTTSNGGRDGVVDVLIVITDGATDVLDKAKFQSEVTLLHQTNIKTFALGVGSRVNRQELEAIASDPSHVYTVINTAALQGIIQALQLKTCDDILIYSSYEINI